MTFFGITRICSRQKKTRPTTVFVYGQSRRLLRSTMGWWTFPCGRGSSWQPPCCCVRRGRTEAHCGKYPDCLRIPPGCIKHNKRKDIGLCNKFRLVGRLSMMDNRLLNHSIPFPYARLFTVNLMRFNYQGRKRKHHSCSQRRIWLC